MTVYPEAIGRSLLTGAVDPEAGTITVRRINGTVVTAWPRTVPLTIGSASVTQTGQVTYDDGGSTLDHPGTGNQGVAGTFSFTLWDGVSESPTYTATVQLTGAAVASAAIPFGALTLAGQGGFPASTFTPDATGHFTLTGGFVVPTAAGDAADLNAGPYAVTVDGVARQIAITPKCWTVRNDTELAARLTVTGATGVNGPANPLTDRIVELRPGSYTWVPSHWSNRVYGNATDATYTDSTLAFELRAADPANKPVFTITGAGTAGNGRIDRPTNWVWRNLRFNCIFRPGTDVATDAAIWNGSGPVRNFRIIGCDFISNARALGMVGCYLFGGLKLTNTSAGGVRDGGCVISGCTLDGFSQSLSVSVGTVPTAQLLIEKTVFSGYSSDAISFSPAVTLPSTADTTPTFLRDVLMHDPFGRDADVDFGSGASLTRATLTGAANATRATFFAMVKVNNTDTFTGPVFQQGTDFQVRLVSAGSGLVNVAVTAVDTAGATAVSLTSSSTYSTRRGEWLGILVSLDTAGTHRLHVWTNRYQAVGWSAQASQAGGGQTLRLSTGTAQIGVPNLATRWLSYWQGVALDPSSATVQGWFVNAADPTYLPIYTTAGSPYTITIPAGLVSAAGTPLVEFGRSYDGWVNGTNTGTGGAFTRAGIIERAHGDGFQSGAGTGQAAITDISLERVVLFEHAEGIPYIPDRQFLFLDDTNGEQYKRVKVFGCAAYVATNYAQFLNAPLNCVTRGMTVVPNLGYWERIGSAPASTTPGLRAVRGNAGTGSWAVDDCFIPLVDTVDAGFTANPITRTNSISPFATPPSVATWQAYLAANFAGGGANGFKPRTWSEFVSAYQVRPGGALDQTIDVGALNGYFSFDFVNGGTSNHPRGAP